MHVSARFVAVLKSWLFSVVLAFAAFAPDGASADNRFHHQRLIDRIVVFGDSLSDSGNAFALLGGQFVAPPDYGMTDVVNGTPEVITLVPDAPYMSERFSNGQHTWIEILARAVGLGPSVKPAFAGSHWKASNYAVGGATAGNIGVSESHLGAQVQRFLLDVKDEAPSDALYVIAIGGNDIRAAQTQDPATVLGAALAAIGGSIFELYLKGARNFLVWNAPDVGRTPAVRRLDAAMCVPPAPPGCVASLATGASASYNGFLQDLLDALRDLPGITIVQFDAFGMLGEVQDDPKKFGLRDATSACIQPHVPTLGVFSVPPFRCKYPEDHFFWDGIHPTRAGHRIIALLAAKELLTELVLDD
jgi:phospholipase/lecithinase/hemolysin